jgi:hypothetical protein
MYTTPDGPNSPGPSARPIDDTRRTVPIGRTISSTHEHDRGRVISDSPFTMEDYEGRAT